LELESKHADVARANVKRAGLESLVEIRVGPAASSLRDLIGENVEPFDLIFIDADKEGYPEYFALSLELSRVGTMIIADNVVRAGGVVDPKNTDERVIAVRAFLEAVAEEDRVEATAIQTVGSKGYDGFALMLVKK
jgi:predicted O-methyltransferase YrrM